MEAFVTALTTAVSATTIFAALAPLAPWIGTLILVSVALYFLRRSVSGAGKGKAKI
jgi:hypothetical protein